MKKPVKSAEGVQDVEWPVLPGTASDCDQGGHTDPEQTGWNES